MNRIMMVTAGLCLAGSLSVTAQEQEEGDEERRDAATQTERPATRALEHAGLSNIAAGELVGKKVLTLTGEEIGEIGAVGESSAYTGRLALVEVGGVLGAGNKTIAIPLAELEESVSDEHSVRTSLTRSTIESHPDFDESSFTPEE